MSTFTSTDPIVNKSIREGRATIKEASARVEGDCCRIR